MIALLKSTLLQATSIRVEQARRRFFEEGQAPTGAVGEAVFESWARCLRLHGNPRERATFQPVTPSRTQLALMKNRLLRQAWTEELPRLEAILSTTSCAAMLTDATGVLIGASCVGRAHEEIMPVATRLGVNLSEAAVGTTAPGVVTRTGKAVCVMGGEHFFDSVKAMHCAAAPIRDIRGQLAGVLDISSEHIAFEFDAAAVAGLYASAIENRLLVAQSTEHLVIRFQLAPELLDSPMVGLIGVGADGRQAWENGVAQSMLGTSSTRESKAAVDLEHRLGRTWERLASLPAVGAAPLTLPNGLQVWARAEMHARDGRRSLVANPERPSHTWAANASFASIGSIEERDPTTTRSGLAPAPATTAAQCVDPNNTLPIVAVAATRLRDSDLELIRKTLLECKGNVSETAARLGVSRGLIYRRLRCTDLPGKAATA